MKLTTLLNRSKILLFSVLLLACLPAANGQPILTPEEQQAATIIENSEEAQRFIKHYHLNERGYIKNKLEVLVEGLTAEILQKERKGYPRSFVKRSKDGQWMGGVNNLMVLNEKGRVIYLKFFLETEDDAKVLNSLTELKYLEILGNIYVDETLNLDQLEKLEEIFFIRNIIKNLVFAKNNNLKFFSSTSSVLEDINFENLKELEYFDVNNAKIKDVSGLKYSKDLKILRIVNRELVGLPVLTDWPNLEYLKVKSDGVKSMPGLAQAKKLKYLSIDIDFDPSNVLFPGSLEELDIVGNRGEGDFPNVANLNNLKKLRVVKNGLRKISGLDYLQQLEYLNLSANNITKLEGLDNLPNLKELHLNHNKLQKIEGLDKLGGLKELALINNQLSKLEGLDNLVALKELHLKENLITKVEGLDKLANIEIIDLERNKISRVENLKNLHDLIRIDFDRNPIETLDFAEIAHLKKVDVSLIGTPFRKNISKAQLKQLHNLLYKGHL